MVDYGDQTWPGCPQHNQGKLKRAEARALCQKMTLDGAPAPIVVVCLLSQLLGGEQTVPSPPHGLRRVMVGLSDNW